MSERQHAVEDLRTLADFVRWGASCFAAAGLTYGHGTDNAADEAFYLVSTALSLPHEIPDYFWNTSLTRREKARIAELFERRIKERKPAAYLAGRAWFMGLPFNVDERVLVPRSPMAELLERRCSPWLDPACVRQILDIGTGSGCIAIAAATVFPGARVDASDVSAEALAVAATNVRAHGLEDRVRLIESDCFAKIPQARYQLILSNPPYVDREDMQSLAPEFRHEPSIGLAAGDDGLAVVRRILAGAGPYLDDDGVLIVEVGNSADALMAALPEVPFTWVEFAHGGDGVFVLTAAELAESKTALSDFS